MEPTAADLSLLLDSSLEAENVGDVLNSSEAESLIDWLFTEGGLRSPPSQVSESDAVPTAVVPSRPSPPSSASGSVPSTTLAGKVRSRDSQLVAWEPRPRPFWSPTALVPS